MMTSSENALNILSRFLEKSYKTKGFNPYIVIRVEAIYYHRHVARGDFMSLDNEFKFYLDNQDEFVKKYNNKHVVVINNKVVGSFKTAGEAYMFAIEKYEPGKFLIQLVTKGDEAYTAQFQLRMAL